MASMHSAAVATGFPLATEAGLEVLREGGNAMDAAVAAAWALGVCEPSASGMGGHTVMLVRLADGRASVIDGSSRAPAAASIESITAREQEWGYRSCTIPSTPATLDWAHARHGALSRARVMAPAIRIAERGYRVTPLQHRQVGWVLDALRRSIGGRLFLRGDAAPASGDMLCQPQLGATLARLSDLGAAEFYAGTMAREIAADMRRGGGLVTEEDLASSAAPTEVEPVATAYGDHVILSAPPPSGGAELLLAFEVLAEIRRSGIEPGPDARREAIALTTSAVFRDRDTRAAGTIDLHGRGRHGLSGASSAPEIARRVAQTVDWGVDAAEEPGETTHLSVSDRDGNIVLVTQSIQSIFGAKVAHPELGFLYNNYLCTCPRTPHRHALRPHCRPRSNIAPTLVLRIDGGRATPVLALGAAGSRRIVSSILQVATAVLDEGSSIADAVAAPRIHGLVGRKVWLERSAASADLMARLRARGREPVVKPNLDFSMGAVHALQFSADGAVRAAADPRRDGAARTLQ